MTVAAAKPMRRRLAYLVAGLLGDRFEIDIGPRVAIAIGIVHVAGAALALTRVDPRRRGLEEPP